jgi:hypothetical protein
VVHDFNKNISHNFTMLTKTECGWYAVYLMKVYHLQRLVIIESDESVWQMGRIEVN